MKTKEEIRVEILTKRLKHLPMMKIQRDKMILEKMESLEEFKSAKNILFYMPIHGEVDVKPIFEKYKEEKTFILPRVVKQSTELTLYIINDLSELEEGIFHIPEPKTNLQSILPQELEFIILPGVAFAPNGLRIGYGQGYFDRMLKDTNCLKVGVAYEFQIIEDIKGEPHDIKVDRIITENRIILSNNN